MMRLLAIAALGLPSGRSALPGPAPSAGSIKWVSSVLTSSTRGGTTRNLPWSEGTP